MSLASCDPAGGEELWMIGKNFMKDSVVVFQDPDRTWVRSVHPNKEFFNATHLIVTVPQYFDLRITQPIKVIVFFAYEYSGNLKSDFRNLETFEIPNF